MTQNPERNQKRALYTAKVHTTGGREGAAQSDDKRLSIQLASPGSSSIGTNPEQLLAAGWSACFLSALQIIASKRKVALTGPASDDVEIDLCLGSDGLSLRARHNVTLPGVDADTARALVEEGHKTCPYSKALHASTDIETKIL